MVNHKYQITEFVRHFSFLTKQSPCIKFFILSIPDKLRALINNSFTFFLYQRIGNGHVAILHLTLQIVFQHMPLSLHIRIYDFIAEYQVEISVPCSNNIKSLFLLPILYPCEEDEHNHYVLTSHN